MGGLIESGDSVSYLCKCGEEIQVVLHESLYDGILDYRLRVFHKEKICLSVSLTDGISSEQIAEGILKQTNSRFIKWALHGENIWKRCEWAWGLTA